MATRILLLLAASSLALPAAAQPPVASPQSIGAVRKNARLHVGPLYATPTVLLKELGVDTNVFNEAGEPKSDFVVTVTPKVDLWVPVARRALISATAATDVVYYATYSSERSINPHFTTRGEVYFHRVTFFAENAYLNTRERQNFEIDLRSRHLQNDATAGVEVQVTPRLAIEAAALRGITRYRADALFDGTSLQKTLNRDTTGYRIVGRRRLTGFTTVATRYESLQDRFSYSPERDADSFRVMPGVEVKARALISGSAYVGYRRFTPQRPGQLPEFSGLVSQLHLSYTLLGSTTLGVSYQRDLTYSYEELQPFFVNDNVGASVRRALGRRFDLLFSIDRYKYSYRDLIGQPVTVAPALQRIDTTWSYASSLGYRVGRDGRVGFGLSYYDRASTTGNVRGYTGLRAGTVVSYGF